MPALILYNWGMAYSITLRVAVLDFLQQRKGTVEDACDEFGISRQTIYNWKELLKQQGTLERKQRNYPIKIDPLKLQAFVARYPNAYLKEIAREFNVSVTGVFYALKRAGLTLARGYKRTTVTQ
ncbi:MAG: hypothetical protein RLZ12_965 [Bacillota bacterium]